MRDTYNRDCIMLATGGGHLDVLKYLVNEKHVRIDDKIKDSLENQTILEYYILELRSDVNIFLRTVLVKQSSCGACNA